MPYIIVVKCGLNSVGKIKLRRMVTPTIKLYHVVYNEQLTIVNHKNQQNCMFF